MQEASPAAMQLDPNTHALVYATALITSISFAIFACNVIAAFLSLS
jgi:hypothetical protein